MPYPGGAALDRAAAEGDETKYPMPVTKLSGNPLDMSFSGLKTAAINLIHNSQQKGEELDIPSLCASFSLAVSRMLVPRTREALRLTGRKKLAVAGGVAANSRIRRDLQAMAEEEGAQLYLPPLKLCGDNGAMIGAQAYYEYLAGVTAGQELNAYATLSLE
jgi:N6-L-threonylcarbamoyladenine synthase